MLTPQTNIALQMVTILTQEELAAFCVEFEKLHKPAVTKCKPKKQSTLNLPSVEVLAQQHLAAHRAKHNIQAQGKLA